MMLHKLRNIQDYLPKDNHGQVWRRFKKMMGLNSFSEARKELNSLQTWLASISESAESSLLEAGEELLTVHKLGLTGDFKNSLSTTNIIESIIGVVKSKVGRVKYWGLHPKAKNRKASNTAVRWAASAIQEHRKKMRKLKGGMKQIERLKENLNQFDNPLRSA
jgi:transposase-like protein